VKILLDECVDRRIAREPPDREVTTVPQRGWAGIKNGDLLALAEQEFDAFVTVDRKISVQQDLTRFQIAVMLLRAPTNRLEHIRPSFAPPPASLSATSRLFGACRSPRSLPFYFLISFVKTSDRAK
jgi:hypothetical protein